MGYFDGIVDGNFKTTPDGLMLFYPYGTFGKGYIIPTLEKKQELRGVFKRFTIFSLIVVLISTWGLFLPIRILSFPWWVAGSIYLAIIAALSFANRSLSKRLTNGLIQVEQKLTLAEEYRNSAKSHNMLVLVLLELASLFCVATGILVLLNNSAAWYFRLNGVLSILFFGFCSIVIGYMIKVKLKG
jgi:hypothetical protein